MLSKLEWTRAPISCLCQTPASSMTQGHLIFCLILRQSVCIFGWLCARKLTINNKCGLKACSFWDRPTHPRSRGSPCCLERVLSAGPVCQSGNENVCSSLWCNVEDSGVCGWNRAVLAGVMEIHKERPFSFNHLTPLLWWAICEAACADDSLSLSLAFSPVRIPAQDGNRGGTGNVPDSRYELHHTRSKPQWNKDHRYLTVQRWTTWKLQRSVWSDKC